MHSYVPMNSNRIGSVREKDGMNERIETRRDSPSFKARDEIKIAVRDPLLLCNPKPSIYQ